jgi:hypothetical protein
MLDLGSQERTSTYKVRVADNFHYMDDEEEYEACAFASLEAA